MSLLRLIAAALLLVSLAHAQDDRLLLGAVEDRPAHYAGETHRRVVRVLFYKDGEDWKAFPTDCADEKCLATLPAKYPAAVAWTIAFDGRNVGKVMSTNPSAFRFYGDVGQQAITSAALVPVIGKASSSYNGMSGEPVFRPLVAVSQPNFDDPDAWKRATLSSDTLKALRKNFRAQFPRVSNCSQNDNETPGPWGYQDAAIAVKTAYASRSGWMLAEVALEGYLCDGPPDDAFAGQWFAVSPHRDVSYLGGDMWLVDAGDYDHDGRSELLFAIEGENDGGYRLFYSDFRKQAAFQFNYH